MNRRTLLKSLAAFPMASALSSCRGEDDDRSRHGESPHRLQVLLDGAFAVVIQKDKPGSVLAFSPRDKDEPHEFYFNDPDYAQPPTKNYNFELLPEGLKRSEHPEIDTGFNDFHATVRKWNLTESLVTIKLPLPRSITFCGHRERVIFLSDPNKRGWMPTNHILEYDVADHARIRMVCRELGEKVCAASPDSPEGLTRFFFEVGPSRGTPHIHAVNFFNYMLRASFPELVAAYSLKDILDKRDERPSTTARLVSAALTENTVPARLENVSYTLDCKVGGILVDALAPAG